MLKQQKRFILLVGIIVCQLFMTVDVHAIPAFARRYKISCSTCHAPIPKLKDYGEEFAGNGMVIREEEKARDYISAGDDLLWINRTIPIGIRFDAYAIYDQDQSVDNDLQSPWGLKLLSGGALSKKIGYYFYFYMSERGEVAGVEDAYIHFDNVFETNLDIMVGQFQTSDPLMKRELRLTFEDYIIYKQNFGESRTNLAYDRGIMLTYGIEKTGTDLVALIVNGNGKAEAGSDKKFDDDEFKNFGFRVNQGIGELFSIGGYFYQGKEKSLDTFLGSQFPENKITYYGPDFHFSKGPIEITAQYLRRKDTNLFFSLNRDPISGRPIENVDYKADGYVIEAVLAPQLDRSRFYLTALYNSISHDIASYDYQTATLSGTYLVARNFRLIGEYTRDLENDLNRMTFGLVSGF